MNQTATYRQISLIVGVIVALVILFGMWWSGSQQTLSQLPETTIAFPDFEFVSIVKAALLQFK